MFYIVAAKNFPNANFTPNKFKLTHVWHYFTTSLITRLAKQDRSTWCRKKISIKCVKKTTNQKLNDIGWFGDVPDVLEIVKNCFESL